MTVEPISNPSLQVRRRDSRVSPLQQCWMLRVYTLLVSVCLSALPACLVRDALPATRASDASGTAEAEPAGAKEASRLSNAVSVCLSALSAWLVRDALPATSASYASGTAEQSLTLQNSHAFVQCCAIYYARTHSLTLIGPVP